MITQIETYFLLGLTYAVAGWLLETVGEFVKSRKIVNRGFLIGPYCPIYGYGVVLITLLLQKYKDDILILFVMSVVISGILEYYTSYIMEKLFNARWWDYSNNKLNINGRVCLQNLILFGIAGCVIVYYINPFVFNLIGLMSETTLNIVSITIFVIYLIDNVVSFKIIFEFKNISRAIKDNTEEISSMVRKNTKHFARLVRLSTRKFVRRIYTAGNKETKELFDNMRRNTELMAQKMKNRTDKVTLAVRSVTQNVNYRMKDATQTMNEKVRINKEELTKRFKDAVKEKSFLHRRLLNAFPHIEMKKRYEKKDDEEYKK